MKKSYLFANCAAGIHASGNITCTAAEAIAPRYLFGKLGSTPGSVALAKPQDTAIGVITDEAKDTSDTVNIQIMGSQSGTMQVMAGGAIKAGEYITCDDNSCARPLEGLEAGTYPVYGIALRAATQGQTVEFTPTLGLEKTV
tara:strand:+ start:3856 stop:4281 length:426 start_codon:yes stop_codon:yes gene_type:complete